jgi:glycosyltransferase involved in cell wall biosynthesis
MMRADPFVSIVIPTLNRQGLATRLVKHFQDNEEYRDFEIIVVDQSRDVSPDLSALARAGNPPTNLLKVSWRSMTRARNLGLSRARGEIVVFVDDDVMPEQGFLRGHISGHLTPNAVGVTGPAPLPGVALRSRDELSPEERTLLAGGRLMASDVSFDYEPLFLPGCNLSVRRLTAMLAGCFDERFYGNSWGEDAEFSHRLKKFGRCHYTVGAAVIHEMYRTGGSREEKDLSEYVRCKLDNSYYHHRACGGTLTGYLRRAYGELRAYLIADDLRADCKSKRHWSPRSIRRTAKRFVSFAFFLARAVSRANRLLRDRELALGAYGKKTAD